MPARFVCFVLLLSLPIAYAQQPEVRLIERAHPRSTTFSASSNYLLAGADGYFQLWDWRQEKFVGARMLVNRKYSTGKLDFSLAPNTPIRFSPDGRFIASCRERKDTDAYQGQSMLAQIWDLRSGETVAELLRTTPLEECRSLDFSPDGNTLALAASAYAHSSDVIFFDTDKWQEIRRTGLGPDVRLHQQLRYSPNGKQIAVWVTQLKPLPDKSLKEQSDIFRRIGTNFMDHRIEAIVLDAVEGKVLARRVLHWTAKQSASIGSKDGFDATGERLVSSVYAGGSFGSHEERTFLGCPSYVPPSIPDGFEPIDLCRRHKAVQVWQWRIGKVDTLFEYPTHIQTRHAVESPEQRTWTFIRNPQFTADGKFLVLLREDVDKADLGSDVSPIIPAIYTLEIREARTYQLLLSKELSKKKDKVSTPLELSPDGRYLTFMLSENRRHSFAYTNYLYELISR